jgi:hypothetical protein
MPNGWDIDNERDPAEWDLLDSSAQVKEVSDYIKNRAKEAARYSNLLKRGFTACETVLNLNADIKTAKSLKKQT